MTDGPFNNQTLTSRWNRFASAIQVDAVNSDERRALASDALLHEILTDDTSHLLAELQAYSALRQLDIQPLSAIDGIFEKYSKTPFADTLQKELTFRVDSQMAPDVAIDTAIEASVSTQVGQARNRIEEECIRARDSGEMPQHQFNRTVAQANAAFDALATEEISHAVRTRDKNAFKVAVSKKDSVDDGPSL